MATSDSEAGFAYRRIEHSKLFHFGDDSVRTGGRVQ
jgi:hypothetical protein